MKHKKGPGRNIKVKDIGPGVWEDADGNPHIDCVAVCAFCGVEPTAENIKLCMDVFVEEAERKGWPYMRRENKPDTDE